MPDDDVARVELVDGVPPAGPSLAPPLTATDTYDGVHPNADGDQKMSARWYPALAYALPA